MSSALRKGGEFLELYGSRLSYSSQPPGPGRPGRPRGASRIAFTGESFRQGYRLIGARLPAAATQGTEEPGALQIGSSQTSYGYAAAARKEQLAAEPEMAGTALASAQQLRKV